MITSKQRKGFMEKKYFFLDFKTPFGSVHLVWTSGHSSDSLKRIFLSSPEKTSEELMREQFYGITRFSSPFIKELGSKITAFLEGAPLSLEAEPLSYEGCSLFHSACLQTERKVPRGKIVTYGLLAEAAGNATAARAAGAALSKNPFPLLIPCHRAIKANGYLGGYQGGTAMKKKLLEREGIYFDHLNKTTLTPDTLCDLTLLKQPRRKEISP
jgi:methylated-DNA-[protein]-cysteine S-methyltransferase